MTLALINAADAAARERFTYRPDPPNRDQWRSHAEAVRAGQPWTGDCDDLGSTALHLAADAGADPARLYRALVASPDCPQGWDFDHYVALWRDETGDWWVFGDTFGRAHRLSRSPHRVHRLAAVADGLSGWREWQDHPPVITRQT